MANELGSDRAVQRCLEFYLQLASTAILLFLMAAWAFFFRGRKLKLPPGPFRFPIIGNLHLMGRLQHKALAALSVKYGPLFSLRLGSALTLVVSSPDMAKEFLKTHDLVFASRPPSTATKYLWYNSSDVTFSPYGRYWRQMRRLFVSQLLSSRRVDSFRFIREEEVSAMIRSIIISYHEGSLPVNIGKIVSVLGIDIICRIAFGRKYTDQQLMDGRGIHSMIQETFLLAGSFNIGDYIPYLAWMDLQGLNRRLKNIHKTQDALLEKIVEEHFSQNKPNAMPDLLDVLLAASADENLGLQITRDNIKSAVYDILSAGSDTSSTSIEWAMSEVLRNPPVLKKIQEELERVVGMGRMVHESDLPRLVYLQAVVKETLRLHPPGPLLLPHISIETCNVLGYKIPSGTRLLVNVWAIGRNPKSWGEDAESFKPERFMEAGFLDAKVENFEWIPFGAGRRGCPGQQMAMIVVEFAVAQLLHCFNWRLPDDMDEQKLDMSEKNHGITVSRAHELFAVPTPRLPVL
uniref:Cytochrome P450 n=1 Tax=Picea sitchensis TaxID=3332 RepID=C0PQV6_PICSI|nr:unknown [Picea sitchensis]